MSRGKNVHQRMFLGETTRWVWKREETKDRVATATPIQVWSFSFLVQVVGATGRWKPKRDSTGFMLQGNFDGSPKKKVLEMLGVGGRESSFTRG